MRRRGRPRSEDVLTPREYEVLALIRAGRSNREIAAELGITLAGAKFHVSEIITKLGVESREQAAAWEPQAARRWGFAPGALLSSWGHSVHSVFTPKVAVSSLALAAAVGLTAGVLAGEAGRLGNGPLGFAAVDPTPTPWVDPCKNLAQEQQDRGCISFRSETLHLASLDEAAEVTSFVPLLPDFIPAGFERKSLTYMWPVEKHGTGPVGLDQSFEPKGPHAPFERLSAEYVNEQGDVLWVHQGYAIPASLAGLADDAPDHLRGRLAIGERDVHWVQGFPAYEYRTDAQGNRHGMPVMGEWQETSNIRVYWQQYGPSRGTAWEIDPEGTKRVFEQRGRPFEYVITSDALSKEELLKVAASVAP